MDTFRIRRRSEHVAAEFRAGPEEGGMSLGTGNMGFNNKGDLRVYRSRLPRWFADGVANG